MNDYGVLTTRKEIDEHMGNQYLFPKEEAELEVVLDFRAWGKRNSLGCYFTDIKSGKKLLLYAWLKRNGIKNEYRPKNSFTDFSMVEDGTIWAISIKANTKGNLSWMAATPIHR